MARRAARRARARPAHDLDHHVRPCRDLARTGRATCWRCATCRTRPAASPSSCRCPSCTWKRRCTARASARRGPTFREAVLMHAVARLVLHPRDHQHPGLVGEDGPGRRRDLPRRGRQRPRRHADERKHLARRRHAARPGIPARRDGGADPLDRPRRRSSATRSIGPVPEERRAASFVAEELAPIVLTPPRKRRRGLAALRQQGFGRSRLPRRKAARARAGRLRQAQEGGEIDRMVDIHGDAGLADHRRLDAAAPRRRRDAGNSCSRRSAAARRRAASRSRRWSRDRRAPARW